MHANDLINLTSSLSSSLSSILINSQAPSVSTKTTTFTPTNLTLSLKANLKKKQTAMEDFLESIGDNTETPTNDATRGTIVEELYNYRFLINKYINKHSADMDTCLLFWKTYEFTLPYLFTLAKRYVCTPATSVPSESAFSTSSYVARKERSRLSVKNLEATMFLKVCIRI
jgi:hypothetical protein